MITFTTDETKVKASVTSSLGFSFFFSHDTGNKAYAALVQERLWREFIAKVSEVRQEAYNKGWKDKTQRKPKQNWFPGNLNSKL